MSNGVSSVQPCSVFPNGCAEFGVNSVSAEQARFVVLLLPLVLPVLPVLPPGPAWYPLDAEASAR